MKLRIVAGGIFGADGEYPVGYEFETDAEIPAGWAGRVAIIEDRADKDAQFLTASVYGDVSQDEYDAVVAERDELLAASQKEYTIGDLTMKMVFEPNGLTNLSDLQSVFDAVEAALSASSDGKEQAADAAPKSEDTPSRDDIAAMEKAEVLEWLEAHGWGGDKRLGVEKLRDALTAIMFVAE